MIGLGNGGVIISTSSISRAGNMGQSNYSATKAGVVAMTVVWAKELARYGIRAGAIAPGFTRTEILDAMKPEMIERALNVSARARWISTGRARLNAGDCLLQRRHNLFEVEAVLIHDGHDHSAIRQREVQRLPVRAHDVR